MANPLQLFDRDGETILEATTDGDTVKPFVNSVSHVVKESQIDLSPEGVQVEAVDPANVFAIETTLHAGAFDSFEAQAQPIALNVNVLKQLVRRARVNHDDTLDLEVNERDLYATVSRGYDEMDVVTDDKMGLIDPDSVRQKPSIPDYDDLEDNDDFDSEFHTVTLETGAFADGFSHANDANEFTVLEFDDGDLLLRPPSDPDHVSGVRFEGVVSNDAEGAATYSGDFLTDLVSAVMASKAQEVSLTFAEEMPLFAEYTRWRDDERVLDGTLMLAPRIHSE